MGAEYSQREGTGTAVGVALASQMALGLQWKRIWRQPSPPHVRHLLKSWVFENRRMSRLKSRFFWTTIYCNYQWF